MLSAGVEGGNVGVEMDEATGTERGERPYVISETSVITTCTRKAGGTRRTTVLKLNAVQSVGGFFNWCTESQGEECDETKLAEHSGKFTLFKAIDCCRDDLKLELMEECDQPLYDYSL